MSERSRAPSLDPELVVTLDGADRTLRAALYRVGRDLTAVFALVAWWRLIQISPGRARRPRLGWVGR
jgi:hypothetical protein